MICRITDSWDWLSGRKNLPEILLGYHQHCGSYYKHSHCNLFWRLDKICYFYKSHYTIITGACGLYWNQMLCERLDGRTRILLKKQGVYDIMSVSEPEACLHGYGERRMSIMIAAKAASSTEGANHDIIACRSKMYRIRKYM